MLFIIYILLLIQKYYLNSVLLSLAEFIDMTIIFVISHVVYQDVTIT